MKTAIMINVLVFLGYCLGGYAGHLLAIPPAYVSPIWPPAGIALAALLLYGVRVLPGLIPAAFLTQYLSFLNGTGINGIVGTSYLVAAGTGLGSILQAAAGCWLIHHYIGRKDDLVEDRRIIFFLFLGGPLSCILGAGIGTAVLSLGGFVHGQDVLLTWSSWWVGDTLGVLILTPMLMVLLAGPGTYRVWRIRTVVLPMLALLMAVMILFRVSYQQEWRRMAAEFERQVNVLHITLSDEIRSYVNINLTLKAFFDSSDHISEQDFRRFAGLLVDPIGGVYALEWIPRVPHAERTAFERAWDGMPYIREPIANGDIMEAPVREEYFPIRYLVPHEGNERAYGADISTNTDALETVQRARDTGRTATTPPIVLIQDPDKRLGTVLYSPVYRGEILPGTVEQRRREFRGVVATVFRVSDSIGKILDETDGLQLNLVIHSEGQHLYNNMEGDEAEVQKYFRDRRLRRVHNVEVADHTWELIYEPSENFFERQLFWNLWWLLLSGFLFTAFTGVGLLILTGHTLRIEELVRSRTRDLEEQGRKRRRVMDFLEMQNEVLQSIVGPGSLQGVLNLIAHLVEMHGPDTFCSILLLDRDGRRLRMGVAPSLPAFYNKAIDGLEIGEGVGSCGTAAARGELVVVEDILVHPYWNDFRQLAERAGLRSSWSQPIQTGDVILGVFTLYHLQPKQPDEDELKLIRDLARIASIAIEQKRSESRIQRLAFYDSLTELPNRRLLLDRLDREIAISRRHNTFGAILFIDLDSFKTLNDSLGHQVGDQLLVQVAQRLRKCIREEDTAARHGGDEFVVMMRANEPDLDKLTSYAHNMAQRIRQELGLLFNLDGFEHHVSASIGITFFSGDSPSPDDILKQADTAMYSAKTEGRNTVVFYHPDMQQHVDNRLRMERDLRTALEEEQFTVLYQPQYDSRNRIVAAEALIRWRHPDRGLIGPMEFIPLAEENRLILSIGEWVMEQVCRQLQEWRSLDYIAINISPVELRDGEFVDRVRKTLLPYEAEMRRLMMEMTEGIMIENVEYTTRIIRSLQNMGIGISIDDFGRGYSSLVYLKNLPLNQLKIDKGFVQDIETDPSGRVIVETIIAMARHLQLDVIAEGVETEPQLAFLQEQGCHKFQGFYFSQPLSTDQFGKLLKENHGIVARG